jgi:hypothetical protein
MDAYETWLEAQIEEARQAIEGKYINVGNYWEGALQGYEASLAEYRKFKAQETPVFRVGDRVKLKGDESDTGYGTIEFITTHHVVSVQWNAVKRGWSFMAEHEADELTRIEESEEQS